MNAEMNQSVRNVLGNSEALEMSWRAYRGGEAEEGKMVDSFPITVTAQMRHGLLWEARALLGSSSALAKLLGVPPTMVGAWINFKSYPSKKWWDDRGVDIEGKLSALLGRPVTYEDLFPREIRTEAFKEIKKQQEATHEVPLHLLAANGFAPQLPPHPSEHELKDVMAETLETLRPRHRQVLKMRFGLDGGGCATMDEVAEELGVSRERVRQIEAKALRVLRHPSRSRPLKSYL